MTNPLNPLQLWLEKKLYLEHQLAFTSDPSQKFTLRKQIQECELEIARLSNQPPTQSNPTTYQFSQSNQLAQSNQSNVSASQQHQCSQENIPKITFNTPKIIDIGVDKLKNIISKVQILLLTVNDWERKALLSEMTPLDGEESILQGALSSITYRIGMFGNYCAAYTESTMGSGGRQGATLTAERAINELKPKAVFLLGIAFGIDSKKQKLGDVLIAENIFPYELQKLNEKFAIYRGHSVLCGTILAERFRMRRSDWKPSHNGQSFDVSVHQGLVLSGEKVVNNKEFRDALVKGFPTAIGGEMEGAGAYSAVTNPTEVILIKSICDWADGDKNDDAQPFAAFTSISLAKHVLSKPDVLIGLLNTKEETKELNNIQKTIPLLYDSELNPNLNEWTIHSSTRNFAEVVSLSKRSTDDAIVYEIKALSIESVGINKSLRTLYGTITVEYMVNYSTAIQPNIYFCLIPMQETGVGRTGLIEVGANVQADPKNPYSIYRKRFYIPMEHYSDKKWHKIEISFDFTQLPTAFYTIFAPRINEGCGNPASGHLLITKVSVFSY
jgi:nucleoside phosphorylase